jgi:DNA invertase Pin-like site-specific DNA recombinase
VKGQRIAYVRVSTADQRTDRQDVQLARVDKTFTEHASGSTTNRPVLQAALAFVREGDTLVVHSIDRLARNLDDLRRLVVDLTGRGVRVEFVKEALTFTGDDSPMATMLLSVMGALAEFERAIIRERQREGIAAARARGAYGGRRRSLSAESIATIRARLQDADPPSKAALAREYGISRQTLHAYLNMDGSK